jgi:3-deoxy-D-manno-octulosonic-acid transferase
VAIINGRMSDHSFPGYYRLRPIVSLLLGQIDLIAAQNDESADRFRVLGAPRGRVHVTGSLKYDGAQTDRLNLRTAALRELAGFQDDDIVFLAGSTQEPEEQIAVDIYRRLAPEFPRLRLVLVPRHPERFDAVAKLLDDSNLPWTRRSHLIDSPSPLAPRSSRLLLVDTIGELSAWWGTTQIAFVGGSFGPRGGQNMIEPAAYAAAVSFGPNTRNFRDIVAALISADAAIVVHDSAELEVFVRQMREKPAYAAELGERAQAFVRSQLGATHRTLVLIDTLLSTTHQSSSQRSAA